MTPHTLRVINAVAIAILLIGFVLMVASCTLVYIEGDSNSVSDTGGHGGGLTIPKHEQIGTPVLDRLRGP